MKYAIGLDLGGTSLKYALVDEAGNSFFEGKLPSLASVSASAVMGQLIKVATMIKAEAADRCLKISGVGLATPGIIDEQKRMVLGGAENIAGWKNIDIASSLEEQLELPVIIGNDANLMGLGEMKYGAGRGCTHIIFLTVGTGIGGTVIIDGHLFIGFANRGAELGHVPLIADGERCACGAVGCLEYYASTSALVRRFGTLAQRQGLTFETEIDGELIVRLYKEDFPLAVDSMNQHCFYLGRGIAGFINVFSPQRVVVGGGMAEAGAFYLEKIKEVVSENVIAECALNTEITIAELGNKAGLIGAASLIF